MQGHHIPHSAEAKLRCSEAQKARWASGAYKNRILDYDSIAVKSRDTQRKGQHLSCIICNTLFFCSPIIVKKGRKYCSRACATVGQEKEGHWNWKEGISFLSPSMHHRNKSYKIWRESVYARDNYTCRMCGAHSGLDGTIVLNPHHILRYSLFPAHRYDTRNGITLCVDCHKFVHRSNKKGGGVFH
jgi:hypothetical protein